MSEIDQQFIEYVVKSLVGKPDAVHIDRRIDEKGVLLELTVDPEDLGRVIGKRGATAQSLRTLLRALGTKNDARYNLKIIDNGTGGHRDSEEKPSDSKPTEKTEKSEEAQDAPEVAEADKPSEPEPEPAEETPESPKDEPKEEPKSEPEPEPENSGTDEEQTSDRLAQTRQELADLDDLDV